MNPIDPTKKKIRRWSAAVCLLALATMSPAIACAGGIELSPFFGYRLGGDFEGDAVLDPELDEALSYGLVLDIPLIEGVQLELLWSHQETDLVAELIFGSPEQFPVVVSYYQIGGMREWDRGKIRPFVVATAGLAEFNPQNPLKTETRFAFSVGGGGKFFFGRHLGVRLDGRLFASYFDGTGQLFCSPDGCQARVSGSLLAQAELAAGLIVKF